MLFACAWKLGRIKVVLDDRDLRVNLGEDEWTKKAGGAGQYIVQLAYHYALLSMAKESNFNYPGFLIVDFPPQLASAKDLAGGENYLLTPFVSLCSHPSMSKAQVIIAGRSFKGLPGAHVIRLGNPEPQTIARTDGDDSDFGGNTADEDPV